MLEEGKSVLMQANQGRLNLIRTSNITQDNLDFSGGLSINLEWEIWDL